MPARGPNNNQPLMLLSADCLDGYFSFPGWPALSETLLKKADNGTAAHWSSSGLGYSWEHDVLHQGFYEGLFEQGKTTVGEAVQYAKSIYTLHESELYAFTLQGDPAMQLMTADFSLDKSATSDPVLPGSEVDFVLSLTNQGLFPATAEISDSLPAAFSYSSYSSSAPVTPAISGNEVSFTTQSPLAWNESLVVTLTAQLDADHAGTDPISNTGLAATTLGFEGVLGDNSDSAEIAICAAPIPPVAAAARSGANVNLSWANEPTATGGYTVHWAVNSPFFTPSGATLKATLPAGSTSYSHVAWHGHGGQQPLLLGSLCRL